MFTLFNKASCLLAMRYSVEQVLTRKGPSTFSVIQPLLKKKILFMAFFSHNVLQVF